MESSPLASLPNHHYHIECNEILRKVGSLLLLLLVISAVFLFFISYSPNPSIITPDQVLNQWPTLTEKNKDDNEETCDLFTGKWIREPRGSIYTNQTCRTLPELQNCGKYGKDPEYVYWRWKPEGCELPRFDPRSFLQIVRGKKLAFIGDSVARNQMESLLCLLSQEETPTDMYKDDKDKYRTWYFPSHDFTLMVMWTEFLVKGTERIINGSASNIFDLHLDRINTNWTEKLPGIHYAIISHGNWLFRKNYFYEADKLIGCSLCTESNITNLGVVFAMRRIVRTALKFIKECDECDDGLVTLLRTYSSSHFEHGSWFDGGYCNRTQPLMDEGVAIFGGTNFLELRKVQVEELRRVLEGGGKKKKRFELLDVTKAMMMRADGHPGSHWERIRMGVNDCLHWCLPGPIDAWNDLLLAVLLKKDSLQH